MAAPADDGRGPVTAASRRRRHEHRRGVSAMRRLLAVSVLTPLLVLVLRAAPCFAGAEHVVVPREAAEPLSGPFPVVSVRLVFS